MAFASYWVTRRTGLMMATSKILMFAFASIHCCIQAASVGAITVDSNGTLNLHVRDALDPNQSVAVQYIERDARLRCCRRFRAASFVPAESSDAYQEVVSVSLTKNYRLATLETSRPPRPYAGVGIIFNGTFRLKHSATDRLTAVADGRKITATLCTSSEGFHVLQGLEAAPVLDIYISLQYSVESPTCKVK